MYKIKRDTTMPKSLKEMIGTYEELRSAIRKYLRKRYPYGAKWGNPRITHYGFSVVKV